MSKKKPTKSPDILVCDLCHMLYSTNFSEYLFYGKNVGFLKLCNACRIKVNDELFSRPNTNPYCNLIKVKCQIVEEEEEEWH